MRSVSGGAGAVLGAGRPPPLAAGPPPSRRDERPPPPLGRPRPLPPGRMMRRRPAARALSAPIPPSLFVPPRAEADIGIESVPNPPSGFAKQAFAGALHFDPAARAQGREKAAACSMKVLLRDRSNDSRRSPGGRRHLRAVLPRPIGFGVMLAGNPGVECYQPAKVVVPALGKAASAAQSRRLTIQPRAGEPAPRRGGYSPLPPQGTT
jgi:hypothetical protein